MLDYALGGGGGTVGGGAGAVIYGVGLVGAGGLFRACSIE
jgi:hypothetical protein